MSKPTSDLTEAELIEGLATKIYMDWNKSKDFTWSELPEYRQNSYREWVREYILSEIRVLERAAVERTINKLDSDAKIIKAAEDIIFREDMVVFSLSEWEALKSELLGEQGK